MTLTYGDLHAHISPVSARTPKAGQPTVGIALQPDAVLSLRVTRPSTRIECASGTLWLTQTNDPTDYFLDAGETFTPRRGTGLVVIQAQGEAALRLFE